jgi:sulfite exporter TauE/SafE
MITLILAALMIGFAGSLHCIGMCGPLVMIVHSGGKGKSFSWWLNQMIYHSGRLLVYASFGVIVGFLGKGFVAYGFQQWLAVISGILLLLMLFVPYFSSKIKAGGNVVFQKVRGKFSSLIQNKKPISTWGNKWTASLWVGLCSHGSRFCDWQSSKKRPIYGSFWICHLPCSICCGWFWKHCSHKNKSQELRRN